MYFEPFGLSGIEALLSGTPVISTDWASFSEWNLHGYTGYRCRTFSEFCWAANNIDNISNEFCYKWAKGRYTLPVVGKKFDRLFSYIQNIYHGKGFYEDEELEDLNYLDFSDNMEIVYE
jgi:glycosyltransferase involved in cell wall biosynthesis